MHSSPCDINDIFISQDSRFSFLSTDVSQDSNASHSSQKLPRFRSVSSTGVSHSAYLRNPRERHALARKTRVHLELFEENAYTSEFDCLDQSLKLKDKQESSIKVAAPLTLTIAQQVATIAGEVLPYHIHNYSSYSASYHPDNLKTDSPNDQSSRWSSDAHNHSQYITLRLDNPAIIRNITFGKFHRDHASTVKEFKILGGMNEDNMVEILHHELKNNNRPETFRLEHINGNLLFPVQFIKIAPLSTFGLNFNYSLWYIELNGVQDRSIVNNAILEYEVYEERKAASRCLNYLRQNNMMDMFHALQQRMTFEYEHPILSELHKYLVEIGDFDEAENTLLKAHSKSLFDTDSKQIEYILNWRKIEDDQNNTIPSPRGGHQMCIDEKEGKIYLLGGWSGKHDLPDFWYYNISESRWHRLSSNTSKQGGPSARSCHKMCFDPLTRSIFVLGQYVDCISDAEKNTKSDFYRYFVDFNLWKRISTNTAEEGGPELLYDHQMNIDTVTGIIYVFGGKIISNTSNFHNYSGLFSYSIPTNSWTNLRCEEHGKAIHVSKVPHLKETRAKSTAIVSRVGHAMVLDTKSRQLYIFSGENENGYLSDMYSYFVDENRWLQITKDYASDFGPEPGFIQRATIDVERQEIYALSGSICDRDGSKEGCNAVKSGLWVYSIAKGLWRNIYQSDVRERKTWNVWTSTEPTPRFGHQFIYNSKNRMHYLFGGNLGNQDDHSGRLDDLWELKLTESNRLDPNIILKRCLFTLRMQKLYELCDIAATATHELYSQGTFQISQETKAALDYLRNYVQPVLDHNDKQQSEVFKMICANILLTEYASQQQNDNSFYIKKRKGDMLYRSRSKVFSSISQCFPQRIRESFDSSFGSLSIV
ncbi:Muskelin N-terminus-domain-containing protein [Spinellus fusiger]|nr:Muskelin N-terminus-domain-containing protein [Spinellus fusiger]